MTPLAPSDLRSIIAQPVWEKWLAAACVFLLVAGAVALLLFFTDRGRDFRRRWRERRNTDRALRNTRWPRRTS